VLKGGDKKGMMKMQNKLIWEMLALSIALLMFVSCAMPSIAIDNPSVKTHRIR